MHYFLVYIYNSLANQQKLRNKFIKGKYGIKIIKAVFRYMMKQYDKQQNSLIEQEIKVQEGLIPQTDADDKKSVYSDVKSDIF